MPDTKREIVVFEPKGTEPKPLRLRLRQDGSDRVIVTAVDANGDKIDGGNLVAIDREGITRCVAVDKLLGLPLDYQDRVALVGED